MTWRNAQSMIYSDVWLEFGMFSKTKPTMFWLGMTDTAWNRGHSFRSTYTVLQWRHNGHDGVSNHQPHQCLLNRLFGRRSKKTSKLRVTGLYVGMLYPFSQWKFWFHPGSAGVILYHLCVNNKKSHYQRWIWKEECSTMGYFNSVTLWYLNRW